jgi:hypothetical protein
MTRALPVRSALLGLHSPQCGGRVRYVSGVEANADEAKGPAQRELAGPPLLKLQGERPPAPNGFDNDVYLYDRVTTNTTTVWLLV